MCSLDTHIPKQIFHPCWWINKDRKHPEPFTIISKEDIENKTWIPNNVDENKSKEYVEKLSEMGKQLCIWPYHCLCGTEGATLENEFAKMVYFHSIVRDTDNKMIKKGTDPYSEMYGIIKPEYSRTNNINKDVLDAIINYDEIYIVGEASSHCVLESVKQIVEYYKDRLEITKRIIILTDCMSPISGFEEMTIKEFEILNKEFGIRLISSKELKV